MPDCLMNQSLDESCRSSVKNPEQTVVHVEPVFVTDQLFALFLDANGGFFVVPDHKDKHLQDRLVQ